MKNLKLDGPFPQVLASFLNEQLAYCDEKLKSWDLTNLDKGLIKFEHLDDSSEEIIKNKKTICSCGKFECIPEDFNFFFSDLIFKNIVFNFAIFNLVI